MQNKTKQNSNCLHSYRIMLPLLIATLFIYNTPLWSQKSADTLTMDLQKVEKRFIDSNFLLLAAHYNVDAQKALIEQAKVWQNPTINTDFMLGADGKFFNYGKYDDGKGGHFLGQYYVQGQQ